ncbi:MAG TPA: hypothetical protein VKY92_07255 [Verrucomicrobiae bacterium]|nr:hypothetical protein [Verrucomicrobiae bacterium]
MVPLISQPSAAPADPEGGSLLKSCSAKDAQPFESAIKKAIDQKSSRPATSGSNPKHAPDVPARTEENVEAGPDPTSKLQGRQLVSPLSGQPKGRDGSPVNRTAPRQLSGKSDQNDNGQTALNLLVTQNLAASSAIVVVPSPTLCIVGAEPSGTWPAALGSAPSHEGSDSLSSGSPDRQSSVAQEKVSVPIEKIAPGLEPSEKPRVVESPRKTAPPTESQPQEQLPGSTLGFESQNRTARVHDLLGVQPFSGSGSSPPEAGPTKELGAASSGSGPPTDTGNDGQTLIGISVAQYELPMKKAEKTLKVAEVPQQNLPGDAAISAGKLESSQDAAAAPVTTVGHVQPGDNRTAAVERTHDLVTMHALRLSQSGGESMRVVIEPSAGTRLSLELRFNNGTVDAQAILHRGDFELLSKHWGELQQRLEPKGVQLGSLECSNPSLADQRQSHRSNGQSAEDAPPRSAFAEFALDGSVADAEKRSAARTKTHRGWETWA